MACACKVNQQLSYLQRKYGVDGPKKKNRKPFNFKIMLFNIINLIVCILLSPIILLTILFNKKKVINIGKVFGLAAK